MKLLELTDFESKTKKEFVVIERIIHIQPHTEQFYHIVTDMREVTDKPGFLGRLFGKRPTTKTEKFEVSRKVVDRNGSLVSVSDSYRTKVLETPEEIAKLLADGTKTTEVKGV